MIKLRKSTNEWIIKWIIKRTYWRNFGRVRWVLYFVPPTVVEHKRPAIWCATFRELEHVDLFCTLFEPKLEAPNPYVKNALLQLGAGEITEAEFKEIAEVYGALPAQIEFWLNEHRALNADDEKESDGIP